MGNRHLPVLLREIVRSLARPGAVLIDATVGDGGHAEALLAASEGARLLGIDLDPTALESARERLARFGGQVRLVHATFADIAAVARRAGFLPVSGVLFDLGLRSPQLTGDRGFSFRETAPLDMRFDPTGTVTLPEPSPPALRRLVRRLPSYTAADVLRQLSRQELAEILLMYGDERYADRIAEAIVRQRRTRGIANAGELAALVVQSLPPRARHGRIHAATKTFQALRIAVNRERESLEWGLRGALEVLAPGGSVRLRQGYGGRVAAISYHSGEDRIVKQIFRDAGAPRGVPGSPPVVLPELSGKRAPAAPYPTWYRGAARSRGFILQTKHPIRPSLAEIAANPRSRSAKLRVLERRASTNTHERPQ